MPLPIIDYASGHLMAFAACAALIKQQCEGGSWHVRLSLAQTSAWLRRLGRIQDAMKTPPVNRKPYLETSASGYGELTAIRHSARLSASPARYERPSSPPGTHAAAWH